MSGEASIDKNFIVVKHNKLIEASYKLSLSEQRVLLSCISQIDSRTKLNPERRFEVSASGISDLMGVSIDQSYKILSKAVERLYERSVIVDDPDPESPWEKLKCRWIESITYDSGKGKIGLRFGQTIIPYLTQLTEQFTKYKLSHVSKMTSVYAIRLYELLVQWQSEGEREFTLDKFRHLMDVSDKYNNSWDLKKRVLNPAIDQINEFSNLWVEFSFRKNGRKITHIQFKFGIKGKQQKITSINKKLIQKLASPGESWEEAEKRIKKKLKQEDLPL